MDGQRKLLGFRLSAIIEIIIGLAVLVILDAALGDGNRYWSWNPHPFWIVILVVAAHYGANEGILAGVLATVFYLLGNVPEAQADLPQWDHFYAVWKNPIWWITMGWVIGSVRGRHIKERDVLVKELDESEQREELISESYSFVRSRKEALEVQIAGQLNSSIEAFSAAKAAETLDSKAVMQGIERLVKSVLGPQKFSLYLHQENRLAASIIHGWSGTDNYTQEFDSFNPIYQNLVGQLHTLCVANEEHERILNGQGILASAFTDPASGRVLGILKIEQMDFTSLSLNTVETFRSLCDWIGTALANARNYQNVKSESIINPDRNVLTYNYFKRQSDYLAKLAKRVGFDLSMLVVKVANAKQLDETQRVTVARQISESVRSVLRNVDLAFDYQTDGEEFSILLPSTSQAGAAIVRDKIAKDIEKATRGNHEFTLSYIVQVLHEAA
jgi:GGDEF domain-containing protein